METKEFRYADLGAQLKKVNSFFCVTTAVVYVLSYLIVFVSFLQKNRTGVYAISMLLVMVATIVMGFVSLKKDSGNVRLRYYMLIGLSFVAAMLIYAYVDYYMRFLAVMPFLGCILFFDTKFLKIAAAIVSTENITITLFREFVLHTYTEEEFVPNLVAGLVVTAMMFLAFYLTKVGKAFNADSLGMVQYEAELQNEMMSDVIEIADKVRSGTLKAMDIVNELQTSSEAVSEAVGDISLSTTTTAESVQNQSIMTQDIQDHLEQSVARVEDMVKVAVRSNELNMESAEKMRMLREEAGILQKTNDTVAEDMRRLQQNVINVKAITKTIFDISSQTNLLALNASIESARAGEAGRGFAVVADEIRNLSERTRQETENISKILDDLAANATETVNAMEESLQNGKRQEEMITEVANQFEEVNENVNQLTSDMNEIEKVLGDLSQANTEIVNDISNLSAVSEEVTALAQQSSEMTDGNFQNAKQAKDILDDVLTVSHGLDKYIKK